MTFREWIHQQFSRTLEEGMVTEQELARAWITAYTESLAQRRRDTAPIDEPCHQWLITLKGILESS